MKKLLLLLAILTNTVTIPGADVDIYGKINMGIWYFSPERFYDESRIDSTTATWDSVNQIWVYEDHITTGLKDTMDIIVSNWVPFGTFGVKFKGNNFGGCIEMGTHLVVYDSKFYGSATTARFQRKVSDYISMEKWYAEWYLNDHFTFLFGKTFAPTNFFPSNQMFFGGGEGGRGYGFNNVGCLSTGTYPMLQLSIKGPNEVFEGKIAVIKPDTTAIHVQGAQAITEKYQCSVKIPKFEGRLGYTIEKGIFSTYGNFAGGFQTYESVLFSEADAYPNPKKDSCYLEISSFVVGADVGVKVGPVSLAVDAFFGQNIGVYGAFVGDKFNFWRYKIKDEISGEDKYVNEYMALFYPSQDSVITLLDTITGETDTSWNYHNSQAIELAFILKITPVTWLSLEGGVGIVIGEHENEDFDKRFHNTFAWYAQTEWTIFELLKITPEIGQFDYGPLTGFGRYLYWGLNTGIEF